ncbi:sensor histidine kinase [Salipiger mucosus]|uniref:histidine kinase n=1 Tax=Salipiger mucosus DSM 16094 TaxID=1123237 RepID=S9Q2A1_9RHOB|nr:ATP-binding protein [Salipiger mucosus]EPX75416.1 Signal transduction histidine kinase HoxJ (hydrogenase regulation) [Salipiger mucosus DSM 16094]
MATEFDTQETISDETWGEVLTAVDRTYAELVAYQERLERQNEELHQARRFIESVLGSVSDIMVVIGRDGAVEEVSASLLRVVEAAPGAVAGRPAARLFTDEGAARLAAALDDLRLSRESATFEAELMTPAGAQPFEIALSARLSDRGRFVGAVLTGRPLGELRRAYAELERSHRQLKEAQSQLVRNEKLASLGRLLAGVAHELNNPISFVYASVLALEKYVGQFETYFQRVQEGAPRAELVELRAELKLERNLRNLSQAIHGARDGAERVRDIVADLRRLSSDGTGERVPFDLVETARVAARWVERGSKSGIDVHYEGPESLPYEGAPGQIQQIVMNLVQNAMDAVQEVAAPRLVMRIEAHDGMARLTVQDNGPGVPDDLRAAIFDPFFTTKPVGQGTGLGLSISAKIAQEHGGRLVVGPGPGGSFALELPMKTGKDGA